MLDGLDRILVEKRIADITLSVAANGKAYVTLHHWRDGKLIDERQWADTLSSGFSQILSRIDVPAEDDLLI